MILQVPLHMQDNGVDQGEIPLITIIQDPVVTV